MEKPSIPALLRSSTYRRSDLNSLFVMKCGHQAASLPIQEGEKKQPTTCQEALRPRSSCLATTPEFNSNFTCLFFLECSIALLLFPGLAAEELDLLYGEPC